MWQQQEFDKGKLREYYTALNNDAFAACLAYNTGISPDTVKMLAKYPFDYMRTKFKFINNAEYCGKHILEHIQNGSNIAIFSDYDVDGLTSGYVMYKAVQTVIEKYKSNSKLMIHYPERKDGYGLNMDFCKKMAENKCGLVITTDNGITQYEEVDYLAKHNIDVVITDHHEPDLSQKLNTPYICNPCYNDLERSYLAGVGVAYHVGTALLKEAKINDYLEMNGIIIALMLGTIADMMPIYGIEENIAYILMGLSTLNNNKKYSKLDNQFLRLLKQYKKSNRSIYYSDIAFTIAPLLNAAGRLGYCGKAAACFYLKERLDIEKGILFLDKCNEYRKSMTNKVAEIAIKDIEKQMNNNENLLVAAFDATQYPKGLHGLIANKLLEHFSTPAIVYSNYDGILSGSCRSLAIFDIRNNMLEFAYNTQKEIGVAGHSQACALNIKQNDLQSLLVYLSAKYREALESVTVGEEIANEYVCTISSFTYLSHVLFLLRTLVPNSKDINTVFRSKCKITDFSATKKNIANYWVTFSAEDGSHIKIWFKNFIDYITTYNLKKDSIVDIYYNVEQSFLEKDGESPTLKILDMNMANQ